MLARSLTWSVLAAIFVSSTFIACGTNDHKHLATAKKASSTPAVGAGLSNKVEESDKNMTPVSRPANDTCEAGPTSVNADTTAGETAVNADVFAEKANGSYQLAELHGWGHVDNLTTKQAWDYVVEDLNQLGDEQEYTEEKPLQDKLDMTCHATKAAAKDSADGVAANLDPIIARAVAAIATRQSTPVRRVPVTQPVANQKPTAQNTQPSLVFAIQIPNSISRQDGSFNFVRSDRFVITGNDLRRGATIVEKTGKSTDLKTLIAATPELLKAGKVEVTDLALAQKKDAGTITLRFKVMVMVTHPAANGYPALNLQKTLFVTALYKTTDILVGQPSANTDKEADPSATKPENTGAAPSTGTGTATAPAPANTGASTNTATNQADNAATAKR